MNEDRDPDDDRFNRFIRDILNEAIKNGKFPGKGNFSIMVAGGHLPIDIMPFGDDITGQGEGENFVTDIEPHTEIQKIDEDVVISVDIPGAKEQDTALSVEDNFIAVTSLTDTIRYSAKIKIPPIKKETLKYSINNGLLEVSASTA